MDCKRCEELLAAYKHIVSLLGMVCGTFHQQWEMILGWPAQNLDVVRQKCKAVSDALMEHWRQDHGKLP